jgi:hypothetical protein
MDPTPCLNAEWFTVVPLRATCLSNGAIWQQVSRLGVREKVGEVEAQEKVGCGVWAVGVPPTALLVHWRQAQLCLFL